MMTTLLFLVLAEVSVAVPRPLQNKGYSLRLEDGRIHPLRGAVLELPEKGAYFDAQIVDQKLRAVAAKDGHVDAAMLEDMTPRTWRVGLHVGRANVDDAKFRHVIRDGHIVESSLDAEWQPSALGVGLSLVSLVSDTVGNDTLAARFRESQIRIAGRYEAAPFGRSTSALRLLHLDLQGGLLAASTSVGLSDGVVSVADKASSTGPFAAADLRFPFYDVWFSLRNAVSQTHLKLEDMGYDDTALRYSTLIGALYSF